MSEHTTRRIETSSEIETQAAGERILQELLVPRISEEEAVVVAVMGDLGAGKTQLTKGIARGLGLDPHELHSPTFALANEYQVSVAGRSIRFNHLDAYRFEDPDELLELGIEDYLYAPNSITIIEWAERVEKYLPPDTIRINLSTLDESRREITIEL